MMEQEPADEAVLAIKSGAKEGAVTYLRIKLLDSEQEARGEGWNV